MPYSTTGMRGMLRWGMLLAGFLVGCEAHFGDPADWTLDDGLELAASREALSDWEEEDGWLLSPPVESPEGVARVVSMVVLGADAEMPPLQVRRFEGDVAGPWEPLEQVWGEQSHYVAERGFETSVERIQLRLPLDAIELLEQVRFAAVPLAALVAESDGTAESGGNEGVGASREALRGELRALGVVPREDWGARPSRCDGRDGRKYRMAIHYTVTPSSNPERQVKAIQRYHQRRGWCDIGYHFLVGIDGSIYEGRPLEFRGAHVGGQNRGNIGISFIGCFHPTRRCSSWGPARPTEAMLRSASRLMARLASIYGISLDGSRVKGHRDHRGASTNCPGDHLYERIPDLIAWARAGGADSPADMGGGGVAPDPSGSGSAGASSGMAASCVHGGGGVYADRACSYGYQCCDGRWTLRASGCGACLCVEETGRSGCTRPEMAAPGGGSGSEGGGAGRESGSGGSEPPVAPPGASCLHSFGGTYAHTACSASYQCCEGRWRLGHGSCGACLCVEPTGSGGCGRSGVSGGSGGAAEGGVASVHAGLAQAGSEVPRAGLYNRTLRSTLGISHEPYGTVTHADGLLWVRGRVSWFGGPADRGISRSARGAITGERVRLLNDPLDPPSSVLASRPEDYYWVAMRFSYSPNGVRFWRDARLLLRNPNTGAAVVVRPVDWGPHTRTRRIVDLSPQTMKDLSLETDDEVLVAFAAPGTPLGPVR